MFRYSRTVVIALGFGSACAILALVAVARDARVAGLFGNSLALAGGTVAASLPLGTLLGWLVGRTDVPGRRIFSTLLAVLVFLPLYLQAAAWEAGFGKAGWFTSSLGDPQFPWLAGWRGAWWVHSAAAVGWVTLIVAAGARQIEPELEEQATQDAGPWQVLWHISSPPLRGYIAVAATWVTLWTLGEMTVTDMYFVRTYAEEIYTGFALGDSLEDAWYHAGPFLLLVAAVAAAAFLALLYLGRLAPQFAAPSLGTRQPPTGRLGVLKLPLASLCGILLIVLVVLPLASLLRQAGGTVVVTPSGAERGWSWSALAESLGQAPRDFRRELMWTGLIGLLGATACTVLATLTAWLCRDAPRRTACALAAAALLLALPAPLVGLSLVRFFDAQPFEFLTVLYRRSLLGPVLATTLRSFPFVLLIAWLAFRSLPDEPLEQAELEGARTWTRLIRFGLPQRRRALGLAWIAALAIATGDLATVILARPVGVTPASVRLFQLAHYGIREQEAALGLVTTLLAVALAAVAMRLTRR